MPLDFISTVRTLANDAKPMFPGKAGEQIKWVTLKARTNGFTILSNIDELDGFRVAEGASIDLPMAGLSMTSGTLNLNRVFWKNTISGTVCVVDILGQKVV